MLYNPPLIDSATIAPNSRVTNLEDYLRAVLPDYPEKPCVLAVLMSFFDDSGTDDDDPVVIMGGLFGTDIQWSAFAIDWHARLQDPLPEVGKPPLREFKAADCNSGWRDFAGYNQAERDLVTRYFRDIIIEHKLQGYAVAVPRAPYDEIIKDDLRAVMGSPERFCVTMVALEAFKRAEALGGHGSDLLIVLDQRPAMFQRGSEISLAIYEEHYKSNDRSVTLFGPNFAPSDKVLALQAADMVAWEFHFESRRTWLNEPRPPRQHFLRFQETGLLSLWHVDKEAVQEIADHGRNEPQLSAMAEAFRHDLGQS